MRGPTESGLEEVRTRRAPSLWLRRNRVVAIVVLAVLGLLIGSLGLFPEALGPAALRVATEIRGRPLTGPGLEALYSSVRTAGLRAAGVLLIAALAVVSLDSGRLADRLRSSARMLLTAAPAHRRMQWWPHALFATVVVLAPGYRFMPNIGNDLGTYLAIARSAIDPEFAIGDLPLRASEASGMPGYVLFLRLVTAVAGFELAVLLLAICAVWLMSHALFEVGRTVGFTVERALLLSALGISTSFTVLGYPVGIVSDVLAYPTPRIVAAALVVKAIDLTLKRRPVGAAALGIAAASVHALDGFVPAFIGLAAGLLMAFFRCPILGHDSEARRTRTARRLGAALLLAGGVALIGSAVLQHRWLTHDVAFSVHVSGLLVVMLVVVLREGSQGSRARWLASVVGLLAGGVYFVARRGLTAASDVGRLGTRERVGVYESVLTQLRSTGMTDINAQSTGSILIVMVLAFCAALPLMSRRAQAPFASETPSGDRDRLQAAQLLALIATMGAAVVAFGGLLQTRTGLVGIASLWPNRFAWLVVPGALVVLISAVPRDFSPGVFPLSVYLLFVFRFNESRQSISLVVLAVGVVLIVRVILGRKVESPRERAGAASTLGRHDGHERRGVAPVMAAGLTALVAVLLVRAVPMPVLSSESSREVLATKRIEAQLAGIAAELVPPQGRIIIPPNGRWGSFRTMSSRGVAFDWKHFTSSDVTGWYEGFRQMCQPDYRFALQDSYAIPSASEVANCYENHAPSSLAAVARTFQATHAIVRRGQWPGALVLGESADGEYQLVVVP